jgi:hypothetical protein
MSENINTVKLMLESLNKEELDEIQQLVQKQKTALVEKDLPKYDIRKDENSVTITQEDIVDNDLIPKFVFTIKVNKESIDLHNFLWWDYYSKPGGGQYVISSSSVYNILKRNINEHIIKKFSEFISQ